MRIVPMENTFSIEKFQTLFSSGLKRASLLGNSILQAWKEDAIRCAEINRLRDLERSKVFDRAPWIDWKF